MPLVFQNGALLIVDGKLAMSTDCCCCPRAKISFVLGFTSSCTAGPNVAYVVSGTDVSPCYTRIRFGTRVIERGMVWRDAYNAGWTAPSPSSVEWTDAGCESELSAWVADVSEAGSGSFEFYVPNFYKCDPSGSVSAMVTFSVTWTVEELENGATIEVDGVSRAHGDTGVITWSAGETKHVPFTVGRSAA